MTLDQLIDELTIIRDRVDGGDYPVYVVVEPNQGGEDAVRVEYMPAVHGVAIIAAR